MTINKRPLLQMQSLPAVPSRHPGVKDVALSAAGIFLLSFGVMVGVVVSVYLVWMRTHVDVMAGREVTRVELQRKHVVADLDAIFADLAYIISGKQMTAMLGPDMERAAQAREYVSDEFLGRSIASHLEKSEYSILHDALWTCQPEVTNGERHL